MLQMRISQQQLRSSRNRSPCCLDQVQTTPRLSRCRLGHPPRRLGPPHCPPPPLPPQEPGLNLEIGRQTSVSPLVRCRHPRFPSARCRHSQATGDAQALVTKMIDCYRWTDPKPRNFLMPPMYLQQKASLLY